MWSRSLHVTVGEYPGGSWHVALVETEYRRGIPRDRELLVDVVTDQYAVLETVRRAMVALMQRELEAIASEREAKTPVP